MNALAIRLWDSEFWRLWWRRSRKATKWNKFSTTKTLIHHFGGRVAVLDEKSEVAAKFHLKRLESEFSSMWAPNLIGLSDNWRALLKNQPFALVFFWGVWSPPDQRFSAVVENLEAEFDERITFYAANLDDEWLWQLALEAGVTTNPTVGLFRFGVVREISVGYRSEENLRELLRSCLEK